MMSFESIFYLSIAIVVRATAPYSTARL
jgi:hypothetical protein